MRRVLVVDDERNIRSTLTVCLEGLGCEVVAAATGAAALEASARAAFDVAFVDVRLVGESGLELVPKLLGDQPELAIVVVTAYATFDVAVDAVKKGAWEFLPKPFTPAQVRHLIDKADEWRKGKRQVAELERALAAAAPEAMLDTTSPRMRATLDLLARAAASEAPVLLSGESGTGKTVLARAVHAESARREQPFVVVSCPTLSEELLASELFGHARGAFTGAVRDQAGRVEAAEGGTLFLDEIGELPLALQAKLLRFLQSKEFERIGEPRTRHADVRIVAATNRDLEAEVRAGRFREDLHYRVNVLEVRVPALRERAEDIVPLARGFVSFFALASKRVRPLPVLSAATEDVLRAYAWPGNVRELRNAIERAIILWPAQTIEPAALPERISGARTVAAAGQGIAIGGDVSLESLEKEHILRVIARAGTLERAAEILGVDASTLWRKRKKYEGDS
jgi:NtrC-family two-component system response regulator AlgB